MTDESTDRPAGGAGAPEGSDGLLERHLQVLADVTRITAASLSLDDVLEQVMAAVSRLFDPEDWSVLLRDEDTGELRFCVAMGRAGDSLRELTVRPGEGVAGWVAEHGEPVLLPDVAGDRRFEKRFDDRSGFTTRSLVAVPLRSRGRVVGVMELVNLLEDRPLSGADLEFLRLLCDSTGVAVDNARTHERAVRLARSDALTGLLNATAFLEELEAAVAGRLAAGEPVSVLFLDVDDFKRVVDGHGHLEGSRVLAEMGRRLAMLLTDDQAATRFGGDEFAALLPGLDAAAARAWADGLRARLKEPYATGGGETVAITVSMGLACAPRDGATARALLKASDVAMYAVKAGGKDACREAGDG